MKAAKRRRVDVEVRYAETDQMGVVHHSVYLVWFELARTRLCLETGYHYADIEKLGYYLVVTRTEARLLRGATYGDVVGVSCWLERLQSRGLRFAYEVERDGEILARGATEHVWVERATSRPCRIPAMLRQPFAELAPQKPHLRHGSRIISDDPSPRPRRGIRPSPSSQETVREDADDLLAKPPATT